MGNSTSSADSDDIAHQNFELNYEFIKKSKDSRYGEISVLQDKRTKEHVALKEILCKSTADFNKEIEDLMHRRKVTHPNLIRLIAYTTKAEVNLCASFYRIMLVLDYVEQDFEQDICVRQVTSEFYTEEQLWYLIESVTNALVALHKKGTAHGDLKPSNIFVTKIGSYKIAEQSLLGIIMPSYSLRLAGFDDVRSYLSPALVQNLAQQELYPKHDSFRSDIFTLGLSILHAATLMNCDQFYNWDEFVLDFETLQRRIASLSRRYSKQLQHFIASMLTLDETKRPSANDLLSRVPKPRSYQNELCQVSTPEGPKSQRNATLAQLNSARSKQNYEESRRIDSQQSKNLKSPNRVATSGGAFRKGISTNQFSIQLEKTSPSIKQGFETSPTKLLNQRNDQNALIAIHDNFVTNIEKSPSANPRSRETSAKKLVPPIQLNNQLSSHSASFQSKIETFYLDYKPTPTVNEVSCFENKCNTFKEAEAPATIFYHPPKNTDKPKYQKESVQANRSVNLYQPSAKVEQILEYAKSRRAGLNNSEMNKSDDPSHICGPNSYKSYYDSQASSSNSSGIYAFNSNYNSATNLNEASTVHTAASTTTATMIKEALSKHINPKQENSEKNIAIVSTHSRVNRSNGGLPPRIESSQSYQSESRTLNQYNQNSNYPGALRNATNVIDYNNTTNQSIRIIKTKPHVQNERMQTFFDKENVEKSMTSKIYSNAKNIYTPQQDSKVSYQEKINSNITHSEATKKTPLNTALPNSVSSKFYYLFF